MNQTKNSKIIAVVALIVALFGLTLGFAAFSSTLTISSRAYVNPNDENFIIKFSTSETVVESTGTLTGSVSGNEEATAADATLSANNISGISANLKEPGDTVTYTFYVHNAGKYDAFLKNITFNNVENGTSFKACTAGTNTTAALVSAACDDISLSIKVGSADAISGSQTVTNHLLEKGTYETVVLTIAYDADGDRADGDFNVSFGDIELKYSTLD